MKVASAVIIAVLAAGISSCGEAPSADDLKRHNAEARSRCDGIAADDTPVAAFLQLSAAVPPEEFFSLLRGLREQVGLPSRTEARVPFPEPAHQRIGAPVVPGAHGAVFTVGA